MKILIMGPKGVGKGRIGAMLSEKLGVPLISVGELLRALDKTHPKYAEVHSYIDYGNMAPQEIVAVLLKERLAKDDCFEGFVLDGWGQATNDMDVYNPGIFRVIVLRASDDTLIKRITGRRICTADGKTYNIYTLPQEELAKCKGELVQRHDDTEEAVRARLTHFKTVAEQEVQKLKEQGLVIEIDAEPLPEVIVSDILLKLDLTND